jgi:hypothetical protein
MRSHNYRLASPLQPILTPDADFLKWKFHAGIKNSRGDDLTEEMIRTWSNDLSRRVECTYDGTILNPNFWYCTKCHEYKGIIPYIPGWSDWE